MQAAQRSDRTLGESVRQTLMRFVQTLRDNDFIIGFPEVRDALELIAGSNSHQSTSLRIALRSLFCCCYSDWEKFDDIFDAFWLNKGMKSVVRVENPSEKY